MSGYEKKVQEYLRALTPRTCYIISRNDVYSTLENLRTEPIYGSKFLVEKISDEKLKELEQVMPKEDEQIFHVLENPFMPKKKPVSRRKYNLDLKEDYPKLIKSRDQNLKSDIFFRQDSEFT